jgi:RNA-directed DNA polymerase
VQRGLSRGSPLSPILGAFYLQAVDNTFETSDVFYVRYMDDFLILTKRRWVLSHAIKQLYALLQPLKLDLHPDKTFIGRIERGFDFLGYRFSRQPLGLASTTVTRFKVRVSQLYEQQQKTASGVDAVALGHYVTRWRRWVVVRGIQSTSAS